MKNLLISTLLLCGRLAASGETNAIQSHVLFVTEIASDNEGSVHHGAGIGAKYYHDNWGAGLQTIQWSLADEAVDEVSSDIAYRFQAGPVQVAPTVGAGHNWEDTNLYWFSGVEAKWKWLFAQGRLIYEGSEGWKAHVGIGVCYEW